MICDAEKGEFVKDDNMGWSFCYLVDNSNLYIREVDKEFALIDLLSLFNALDNPCDTDHMRFWVTQYSGASQR